MSTPKQPGKLKPLYDALIPCPHAKEEDHELRHKIQLAWDQAKNFRLSDNLGDTAWPVIAGAICVNWEVAEQLLDVDDRSSFTDIMETAVGNLGERTPAKPRRMAQVYKIIQRASPNF